MRMKKVVEGMERVAEMGAEVGEEMEMKTETNGLDDKVN